jgi:hypothetical protein
MPSHLKRRLGPVLGPEVRNPLRSSGRLMKRPLVAGALSTDCLAFVELMSRCLSLVVLMLFPVLEAGAHVQAKTDGGKGGSRKSADSWRLNMTYIQKPP